MSKTQYKTLKTLEFNKILEMLAGFAKNDSAKKLALSLTPSSDFNSVDAMLSETNSATGILLKYGSPELVHITDVNESVKRLKAGGGLSMSELLNIAGILKGARIMKKYTPEQSGALYSYIEELTSDKKLEDTIYNSIVSAEEMADGASPELASIRRKTKNASAKIRSILDNIIHSSFYRKILQDPIVTVRNERYVIPVKAEHKSEIHGIVHDMSSSGSTLFIEPEGVVNANNELHELSAKEKAEIERILLELSAKAAELCEEIQTSFELLTHLDLIFAKGKLGLDMKASIPKINSSGRIFIKKGRHPLIERDKVVPVDISLGKDFDALIITGPNTGGKTVILKTIGLFCLMTQAGLFIPAADESEIPVFPSVFADIGDEQSIEQSLSTFSSHIKNIVDISRKFVPGSLVLFDELGAGTDPIEGAALATSLIEDFRKRGAKIAATTHYSELKLYALSTEGVENASCEFDVDTLSPTYRLIMGIPGKSNAFAISEKLGISSRVITTAKELLSRDSIKFEDILSEIESNRISAEKALEEAEKLRKETEGLKAELKQERDKIEKQKDKIYDKAREKAEKIITATQNDIEGMMSDLKALKKERDDKETLKRMEEIRKSLNLKRKNNVSPKTKTKPKSGGVNLNSLKLGASVMINDLGDKGSVLSINKKDNTAVILVGIMKITASADNLTLLDDEPSGGDFKEKSRVSTGGLKKEAVKSEIDLRGMTLEEAEMSVDKFLDECAVAGLTTANIIHGKGTGTLRSGIHAMLRHHPHVKKFRLGRYGEGENGVTVIELK